MKKLLALPLLLALSIPAQASYSLCVSVADAAKATMSLRQMGDDYDVVINMTDSRKLKNMIDDAYSRHQFISESFRIEAEHSFAMEYFAKCLDGDY